MPPNIKGYPSLNVLMIGTAKEPTRAVKSDAKGTKIGYRIVGIGNNKVPRTFLKKMVNKTSVFNESNKLLN